MIPEGKQACVVIQSEALFHKERKKVSENLPKEIFGKVHKFLFLTMW